MKISDYAKAVQAAALSLGGTVLTAIMDGQITAAEWVGIVVAVIVVTAGVWATPSTALPYVPATPADLSALAAKAAPAPAQAARGGTYASGRAPVADPSTWPDGDPAP